MRSGGAGPGYEQKLGARNGAKQGMQAAWQRHQELKGKATKTTLRGRRNVHRTVFKKLKKHM